MEANQYYQREYFDGQSDEDEHRNPSERLKSREWAVYGRFMKAALVVFAILSMTLVITTQKKPKPQSSINFQKIFGSDMASTDFSVEVVVDSPGYGQLTSVSMLPWDVVAEPHRAQTVYLRNFTLNGVSKELNDDDYVINWTINKASYSGVTTSVKIKNTGVLDCTVTISPTDSESSYTLSHSFTMAVKYVRREIRNLTTTDRTEFFDALNKMYTVDSTTGKALYGAKFQTAEYFLFKHLNGAATTDCDHWHDGESSFFFLFIVLFSVHIAIF